MDVDMSAYEHTKESSERQAILQIIELRKAGCIEWDEVKNLKDRYAPNLVLRVSKNQPRQ